MIKVELHAHTNDDAYDRIPHSTRQLIDRAARLGYGALAITLHDRQLDIAPHDAYARERNVVLLRGIERTISGRHVLLINYPAAAAEAVRRFGDVPRLKAAHPEGLVVVPHPFYPIGSAMGDLLDANAGWVDAIEVNAMYTRQLDYNRRAIEWARQHGKPLVGNTDLHRLAQMNTTTSLVDAPPEAAAICQAIREGRVTLQTVPLSWPRAVWLMSLMVLGDIMVGRLPR
jgi:predicted metal-dependent phosphoesterase TrpH